ncbi:MAG: FtsX-like permease family protein [Chloroflexi bacterium]|nr:FtsX-like permease family protein [Chloroflexota bacterium]
MKTSTVFQMMLMALQYMGRRKLRTLLTTLAIVFGVAMIFALNLLMPSMLDVFSQTDYTPTTGVDISVMTEIGAPFEPQAAAQLVAQVDGVEAVSGVLWRKLMLPENADFIASSVEVFGVDPVTTEQVHAYPVRSGRMLQAGDTGVVVVPPDVAGLDEMIKLITVDGVQEWRVVGVLADDPTDSSVPRVFVPLGDTQAAFDQPGLVNLLEVSALPGQDVKRVESRIESALGGDLVTERPDQEIALAELAFTIFNMMGLLALFVGGFLIFNTFRTIVAERRRDTGMLRAIGATRRQIMQLLVTESVIQGVVGTLVGLALGYLLASLLLGSLHNIDPNAEESFRQVEIILSAESLLLAVGMGVFTPVLAALIPSWQASRTSPLEALRPSPATGYRRTARWALGAGVVVVLVAVVLLVNGSQTAALGAVLFLGSALLIAPSLVIPAANLFEPMLTLWFAREGDIARSNMVRQPGRAAVTASTLMIGLAIVILLAATSLAYNAQLDDMMDASLSHDIQLMTDASGTLNNIIGADASLKAELQALPDVDIVSDWRYASSNLGSERLEIMGIDPEAFAAITPLEFTEGEPSEVYEQLATGRTAILNPIASRQLGLELGDSFELQTAQGPQTYRVVGIADQFFSWQLVTLWISQDNMAEDFHVTDSIALMLNLAPGADRDAAFSTIQAIAGDYPQFAVEWTSEYREEMVESRSVFTWMNYGLSFLIVGPAALGLLNTLTINILERTREIGVVRAIGASRTQVRRIIVVEALLLGLFGAALGVIVGAAVSYGFTIASSTYGTETPYIFPAMGIISAVMIALLLALFASILPARHAARLDIIRALQYE